MIVRTDDFHPPKPMPRFRILPRLALAAALALPRTAAAQAPVDARPPSAREVVLDGLTHEWDATPSVFGIPQGQGESAPRYAAVARVKVRHDADAVYLQLTLNGEFSLQEMPGTLALLLDADADPATGRARHGMRGVDAAIEFSAALGSKGERMGTGLRLMRVERRAPSLVSANVAGVMSAPTHASRWHEVRIPRGGAIPFGGRMAARLVSMDAAGRVVGRTRVFTAELADAPPRRTGRGAGPADPLARAPGTDFRVVSWNVGREDLFRRPDAFGALLRPLAPDLLVLDEVAGGHTLHEVQDLLNHVVPGDRPWRAVYGTSGGSQRGVIAVRGPAPAVAPAFAGELPYPDSTRAILPPGADSAAQAWLRTRIGSNVPATGAVVEIGGRRLLAVAVDLESGGVPAVAKGRLRRIEALAIHDAVAATVRAGGVDGVLVAGDVNLVASVDPLAILSAGPDVDGSALYVPLPLRLDGASAATWEDPKEPFTPGRLDYVLVGDATLGVTGGFVFRAGDLSPAWQARHGVDAQASAATDHLPVVTDLRWTDTPR
jgi:hypothetical protein